MLGWNEIFGNRIQEKVLILKKYLVSCLLGFLSFGVHLAGLSFSCATEGPTSVIPQWQKGKCESESTLGDTRRGYSVNCTPARLTLLREECRRGFACMIRYAAEIILLTVVLGRISYTAAITPSRYSSLRKLPWVVVYERFVAEINTSHRMRKEEAVITLLHGEDLFRIG